MIIIKHDHPLGAAFVYTDSLNYRGIEVHLLDKAGNTHRVFKEGLDFVVSRYSGRVSLRDMDTGGGWRPDVVYALYPRGDQPEDRGVFTGSLEVHYFASEDPEETMFSYYSRLRKT